MPPAARPPAQSIHAPEDERLPTNEVMRHVPAFLNVHHCGSVEPADARSITISLPETCDTLAPSLNVHVSCWLPELVSQAKSLFLAKPEQSFHRRLTPTACASGARARQARTRSSVSERGSGRMSTPCAGAGFGVSVGRRATRSMVRPLGPAPAQRNRPATALSAGPAKPYTVSALEPPPFTGPLRKESRNEPQPGHPARPPRPGSRGALRPERHHGRHAQHGHRRAPPRRRGRLEERNRVAPRGAVRQAGRSRQAVPHEGS